MLRISATEQSFEVVLGARDAFDQAGPCPRVDATLTARLGEIAVPLITRGGKIGDIPGDDVSDNYCGTVKFRLDGPPPDGAAVLELADPKTRLGCTVPDLKAARELMLVPPESGTWPWRAGQAVAVQWSPSGDLRLWAGPSASLLHITDGNVIDGGADIRDEAIDGDVMRFTVPSAPPGSYELDVGTSQYVTCGPHRVSAEIASTFTRFVVGHAVAIVP